MNGSPNHKRRIYKLTRSNPFVAWNGYLFALNGMPYTGLKYRNDDNFCEVTDNSAGLTDNLWEVTDIRVEMIDKFPGSPKYCSNHI